MQLSVTVEHSLGSLGWMELLPLRSRHIWLKRVDGPMHSGKTLPIQETVTLLPTPFRNKLEHVLHASFKIRMAPLSSTSCVLCAYSMVLILIWTNIQILMSSHISPCFLILLSVCCPAARNQSSSVATCETKLFPSTWCPTLQSFLARNQV